MAVKVPYVFQYKFFTVGGVKGDRLLGMPMRYTTAPGSKKNAKHSQEVISNALADLENGMSLRKCGIKHGIDKSVLLRHKNNMQSPTLLIACLCRPRLLQQWKRPAMGTRSHWSHLARSHWGCKILSSSDMKENCSQGESPGRLRKDLKSGQW